MKPLNPDLFEALRGKFLKVKIVNAGSTAHYTQVEDWFSTPLQRQIADNRPHMRLDMWGETYSMCCPKCNDKRFRLYVSHVWGVYNEKAGRKFYPVKCHNENCDWSTLANDLFSQGPQSFVLDPKAMESAEPARKMEYPCDPSSLIPVNKLPAHHPVIEYLESRNFCNVDLLAEEYGFCYCENSPWKRDVKDSAGRVYTVTPSGRMIIPNIQNGVWAGWQARYIGDIPKDPSTGKPVIQKYLNAPGYSFGTTLYRLQNAVEFTSGQLCLVSEGALSAVACGFAGICTFGMFPKPMQEELIAKNFANGKAVFLVEHEAQLNGRIYDCISRLNSKLAGGCISVNLPVGMDAASMSSDDLFKLVSGHLSKETNVI